MPRLTKIYTKTGDAGQTGLGDGSRAEKTDPRVEAYGDVDEANSSLGVAIASCASDDAQTPIRTVLTSIQQDLFDLGADLCTPIVPEEKTGNRLRIVDSQIVRLEKLIDTFNEPLGALESFILPGGSLLAANLHMARAVTRRSERRIAGLLALDPNASNPLTLVYVNRLSDLLFVLARSANLSAGGDVLWTPGANRLDAVPKDSSL
jgi:cob(I)alamin adenosyltransferase